MSKPYQNVFSLTRSLYAEGAPLIIVAGRLLLDTDSERLVGQLKFCSVSSLSIKAVKIKIFCFDSKHKEIGEPLEFEYRDLNVGRNDEFGSKTPILLPNKASKSFEAEVIEVRFENHTVWEGKGSHWEPFPETRDLLDVLKDETAFSYYKFLFGDNARYEVQPVKDLWICSCGALNHQEEECCHICGASFAEMKKTDRSLLIEKAASAYDEAGDKESLKKAIDLLEKIGDKTDTRQKVEECREKLEVLNRTSAKKRKKIAIVSSVILGAMILLGAIGYFVAYPGVSYLNEDYSVYINMYQVKEFAIPDGNTYIKESAFEDCTMLEKITVPESVTEIGNFAFTNCDGLTEIDMPFTVTSLGEYTFFLCDELRSFLVPSSVNKIGSGVFRGCRKLEYVVIPSSVESIGTSAFLDCDRLKTVYYEGTREEWENLDIDRDNSDLIAATCYYYSETEPDKDGYYWHYGTNGEIVIWE